MEKKQSDRHAFQWSRGIKYIRTQMDVQIERNPDCSFVELKKTEYALLISKLNAGFKFEYKGRLIKKMGEA